MSSFLHFDKDLDDVATELVRLSMLCGVHLREPGMVQAVLEKHSPVGCTNELAFNKMRGLLVLAYHMVEESAEVEGVEATVKMLDHAIEQANARREKYN